MASLNPVRARTGISLFFFTNGLMMAGLLPRYPEIKASFDLSNTAFGLMVAISPLAAMLASALPAPLIRRFGAQAVSLGGTIVMALAVSLAGFAPVFAVFAIAIAIAGFTDSIVVAAKNVHGVIVEAAYRRTIINSLHALWSLGATLVGLVGAIAAGMRIPQGLQLSGVAAFTVVLAALATWLGRLPVNAPAETPVDAPTPPTKLPAGAWSVILPLAVLAIAGSLVEDIGFNWSAVYLVQNLGATAGVAGFGYTIMLGSQFVGRLLGDPATDRWGRVAVIKTGGVLIAVGGILVVTAPGLISVMVGYALAGFGCATVIPAAYAAAGRLPGLPEGTGITLVSWLLRIGFLACSPIIGAVSDLTNLRVSLCLLIVAGIAVFALAPVVRGRRQATTTA